MRITPAQYAILLICGEGTVREKDKSIEQCVEAGHEMFVRLTGRDFGYDLQAWHDYLKESRDGGYTYGRNIVLPKCMKAALESDEWRAAVERLKASPVASSFVADGRARAAMALKGKIAAEVEAEFAERLEKATPYQRIRLKLNMVREINRRLEKEAPPDALY